MFTCPVWVSPQQQGVEIQTDCLKCRAIKLEEIEILLFENSRLLLLPRVVDQIAYEVIDKEIKKLAFLRTP